MEPLKTGMYLVGCPNNFCFSLHTLNKPKWVTEQSLTKMVASKYKISVRKVYKKDKADLSVEGRTYKGLQITIMREGKKPLVATWGGVPLTWDVTTPIGEELKHYGNDQNENSDSSPNPANNAGRPA